MPSPQSQSRPASRHLFQPAIGFVLSLSCCLLLGWHGFPVNKPAAASFSQAPKYSEASPISLFAAGHGNPYVNVTDGRPLSGELTLTAENTSTARLAPLALTAGDFTGDGWPDLISTYTDGFQGIVRLHPGNMDARYPTSPAAQAHKQAGTFSDEPFLSARTEVLIPQPAHFVGTGDFNVDGRLDLVTAAQGGTALFWLAGNGQGGFEAPLMIEVNGLITAFASGEINQPDGAQDIVVGITRQDQALALVFESTARGLFGTPKTIALPFPATSLALGRVNDDSWSDLVVAAGTELQVIQGRDRLSVLNEPSFDAALKARRVFSEPVVSVATGRFTSTTHDDIALSTQSGEVLVLDDVDQRRRELSESDESSSETRRPVALPAQIPLEQWQSHQLGQIIPQARLVVTKTSSLPTDDLMVVGAGSQLRLLTAVGKVDSTYSGLDSELVEFSAFTPPVAALPMRLNGDGLDDLVILSDTEQPLSKLVTEPLATFVVTNTGDNGGVNPAAGAGTGTLRQAIVDANATVAADMISFNIAGAGVQTITLAATLPNITRPVTIDGTTQPGASTGTWPPTLLIELNGTSAGAVNGLNFTGANSNNSVVKGLIVNRFNAASPSGIGIRAAGPTNITIQYNLIGTDSTGNVASANRIGISISNTSASCVIGGTTVGERNLVSGNSVDGINVSSDTADGATIRGNIVGLNAAGAADLGNTVDGIGLANSVDNVTIGGSTASDRNIISGNDGDGIEVNNLDISGTLIQGNFIGTDLTGASDLGNTGRGIFNNTTPGTAIGGSTATPGTAPGNVISGNNDQGVEILNDTADGVTIRGNIIGLNAAGNADLGNTLNGVRVATSADNTAIGGTAATDRNVISGNDEDGVEITDAATPVIAGTMIQGNFIGTDLTGAVDLGNTVNGVSITNAPGTAIGGTTTTPGTAPGNVISGNNGQGIDVRNDPADGTTIQGNIVGLTAAGTADLGNTQDGIRIANSADTTAIGGMTATVRNVISGNDDDGIDVNDNAITGTVIQGNFIGTDLTGAVDLGNTDDGIVNTSAPGTTIGGSTTTPGTAPGNVISGNNSDGVEIVNDAADGTTFRGNIIGLTAAGTSNLGNGANGILVGTSSDNTVIGGSTANDRNIISGNTANGIDASSTASTGTMIQGNYIGTDINGTADLGNGQDGITTSNPACQIGGSTTTPGTAPGNVISGNDSDGVSISNDAADGCTINGNIIGLSANGTADLGNSFNGVQISGSADNTLIGGTTANDRNILSGNDTSGMLLTSTASTGSTIQGNFIGTDITGTLDVGNTQDGINVDNTPGAQIGGMTTTPGTAPGNVISGNNSDGIEITGDTADTSAIRGNIIGLNATGAAAVGNGVNGVLITNSADTATVGGTTANERNVISGNGQDGVRITATDTTGHIVSGNFIGTDINGTADLGNSLIGVEIISSSGNTIGGTTAGARNIISGNTQDGVSMNTVPATNNLVIGNFIGTDVNGTTALGNSFSGVRINGCSNNTVGGTTAGTGNLLSGNAGDGVAILGAAATGNQVIGNFIGTDINGTADLGNLLNGVEIIGSSGNTVGGTTVSARNIISGNTQDGVSINTAPAANNLVIGNFIGTNVTGTSALGNSFSGVRINGCSNNRVGGTTAGERNILSANTGDGVAILGAATGNQIVGNSIGTTVNGTGDLGNLLAGIELLTGSSSTEVRGNVISCNHRQGGTITALNANIYITGSNSNTIAGNIIGLQANGSTFAPNGGPRGVFLANGSSSNQVGGTTVADRNVISGHQHNGVEIFNTATANQIQGNFIGVASDGTTARSNGNNGVGIGAASNNLIGGTGAGEANLITANGRNGVSISSGTGNQVLSNVIFANTLLGIDLGDDGVVQANDTGDGDSGGNNLQNFPVLSAAYFTGTTTQIQGTLNSTAGRTFRIEFFTNPTCDSSGNGEGQVLLSSMVMTTNGSGNATINVTLAMATTLGETITATATDQTSQDTSEFSACRTVTLAPPTLTKSFTPDTILVGQTSVLTFTITNPNSNSGLSGISFTDPLPGGVLIANPNGLVNGCGGTVTATSGTGTITYGSGNLAANGSCTFSVTVLGATTGTKVNTTNPISAMESGSGGTATATLVVGETVEFAVLYVADTTNNRIQRFDGTTWSLVGTGVVGSGNGQFRAPEAVTANPSGLVIYVADTNNNRIQWSTDGGANWSNFATVGSAPNQVRSPQGVALDRDGNLYVSDTGNGRVMRFTGGLPGAGVIIATNGAASGQVSGPRGLAINSAFELFVTDETNSRILRINNANTVLTGTSGTIVATAGSALNKVQNPQGIAVDNTGNMYVADTGNSRILRWTNSNPNNSTSLALVGSQLGQVNRAEGVTICQFAAGPFAGQSSLVVGDTLNNRIQGRLLASGPWALIGAPNGIGSGVGQFRAPSKIR
ncbi:MAG: DUF11 domain-containing protein [Acidobacteria bacterium]|nr:DUF11 domain-containing protein [Acidobacteriota bacterium]